MSDDKQAPAAQATLRLSSSIAEIEHILRQTGCLKVVSLPHEVEVVIAKELAHFFDLGQQVSHALILDLKQELLRIESKVDMLQIDFKAERRANEILKSKLEALGGS